ncbi:unnamed protein product, partial [Musa textilis]
NKLSSIGDEGFISVGGGITEYHVPTNLLHFSHFAPEVDRYLLQLSGGKRFACSSACGTSSYSPTSEESVDELSSKFLLVSCSSTFPSTSEPASRESNCTTNELSSIGDEGFISVGGTNLLHFSHFAPEVDRYLLQFSGGKRFTCSSACGTSSYGPTSEESVDE